MTSLFLLLVFAVDAACAQFTPVATKIYSSENFLNPNEDSSPNFASLYDQNDGLGFGGIASQDFIDIGFSQFNCRGADDFVVPVDYYWSIKEVIVSGSYDEDEGPAQTHSIIFYEHDFEMNGPGVIVFCFDPIFGHDDGFGKIRFELPQKIILNEGKYWMSVQAHLSFSQSGQWFWSWRTSQDNDSAVWRNPRDGFSTLCTTFESCTSSSEYPDLMFALRGNFGHGSHVNKMLRAARDQ